ncbi:MAG: DUF3995 domain-containing protein [Hyphomicrobiales bacterium]
MEIIGVLLFAIFILLGILHYYWAFGGKKWLVKALRVKRKGKRILSLNRVLSFVVGTILILFGVFYLTIISKSINIFPEWIYIYFRWIIPVIFLLRAIGDFKHVGFFKKRTYTAFSRIDLHFHTPLCLVIGILGIQEALIV